MVWLVCGMHTHTCTQDEVTLRSIIQRHVKFTNSALAKRLLADWDGEVGAFVKVFPKEYRRAMQEEKQLQVGSAVMTMCCNVCSHDDAACLNICCQPQVQQQEESQVGDDAFEQLKQLAAKAAAEHDPKVRMDAHHLSSLGITSTSTSTQSTSHTACDGQADGRRNGRDQCGRACNAMGAAAPTGRPRGQKATRLCGV